MGTLLLVKHSKPRVDPAVPPTQWTLGKEGHDLVKPLAAALSKRGATVVVTSHETKAAETGRLVAHRLKIACETADDLHEIDRSRLRHFANPKDLDVAMKEFFENPSERILGRESGEAARSRFSSAVHAILTRHASGVPAIVSHGTVISLLAAAANDHAPFALWKKLAMPSFLVLETPTLRLLDAWPAETAPR